MASGPAPQLHARLDPAAHGRAAARRAAPVARRRLAAVRRERRPGRGCDGAGRRADRARLDRSRVTRFHVGALVRRRTARSTIVYPAIRGGSAEVGYTMVDRCVSRNERWGPLSSDTQWSTVVYPDREKRASFEGYTMVAHVSGPTTQCDASPALLRSSRP